MSFQFSSEDDPRAVLYGPWDEATREEGNVREVWALACPLCAALVRPSISRPGHQTDQQRHTDWHVSIWRLADRS